MESKSVSADHHKAAAASPVMDVVTPPQEDSKTMPHEIDPIDKLAAEDKAERQITVKKFDKKPSPKPIRLKKPGNDINTAIAATVIIVLGLAALATYAYMQTAK